MPQLEVSCGIFYFSYSHSFPLTLFISFFPDNLSFIFEKVAFSFCPSSNLHYLCIILICICSKTLCNRRNNKR